jgi:hypothetical protein
MTALDQRFYASTYGRFNSADPYAGSAGPQDPGSWNRYSYVAGDPVNRHDPHGLVFVGLSGGAGTICGDDDEYGDPACPLDGALQSYCSSLVMAFGSAPVSDPTCAAYNAIFVPVSAPTRPAQPSCSISLDERPVPNVNGTPADHTYLTVTNSSWGNNGLLIEGGPTGNPVLSSLWGYDTQAPGQGLGAGTANASDPSLPSNVQIGSTYSGAAACGAVQYLMNQVNRYDSGNLAAYNFLAAPGTYNSNSFIYTLLFDLNSPAYGSVLSAFGTTVPPWVPGWEKLVPGL